MTEPLHQVTTRIERQLKTNAPVDKEDIQLLLQAYKSEQDLNRKLVQAMIQYEA